MQRNGIVSNLIVELLEKLKLLWLLLLARFLSLSLQCILEMMQKKVQRKILKSVRKMGKTINQLHKTFCYHDWTGYKCYLKM